MKLSGVIALATMAGEYWKATIALFFVAFLVAIIFVKNDETSHASAALHTVRVIICFRWTQVR